MKPNEVVEILPDGTVYYFDLDVCENEAVSAIRSLCDKQDSVPNFDFLAGVYKMFSHCAYILAEHGWSEEDLMDEVLISTMENEEDSEDDVEGYYEIDLDEDDMDDDD